MNEYDLIVIGAGLGGYTAAARAALMRQKVLLIERDELGGTCLNRGCIPTKALCRSAEVAMTVADASAFGVGTESSGVDFATVMARKDSVVAELRQGVETVLRDVTVVKGDARFESPHIIEVGNEHYTAPRIIIATGSRPAYLDLPGKELAMDSDRLLAMHSLPKSIIIIGGGVIGMEFASILSAFGVDVTVIEYCKEILPPFDSDIAKRLRMSMRRRGVKFITSAKVTYLADKGDDVIEVGYETKGKACSALAQHVLMAVGRKPVIPQGLEALGVKMNGHSIDVDENMQTSLAGVYAIGDVNGICMLAHAAEAQGLVALGLRTLPKVIPSAVFTKPECAMAGITEQQAQQLGLDYRVGQSSFRANGKAMAIGEPDGVAKVIADMQGRLLGVHICGAHAADIVQEAVLAISSGLSVGQMLDAVHGHPTLGEALKDALENVFTKH